MDINIEANLFLFECKVGDYYISGGQKIEVLKKTKKTIHFNNGVIIRIKMDEIGRFYLDSKAQKIKNKNYPIINQVLRDIEGWLIYNKLIKNDRFI